MSYGSQNPWSMNRAAIRGGAEYDLGLRQHMLRVYNYMASGLALTGIVAWFAAASGFYLEIAHTPLIWVVMLAPIGLVMLMSFGINRLSFSALQGVFWLYSALMGLSLAAIFLVYTHTSIAEVFFITAGMFLSMSLYGYTTQTNLARMGSFMVMGLFGLIIASVVNIFMQSSALHFAVSVAGVIIFTGLTAWDTQQIKEQYDANYGDAMGKVAIMGALRLYLDFINLFMMLLQLLGDRRSN